jgi:hypothetical protein
MAMRHFMFVILLGSFLLAVAVGCSQPASPAPPSDAPAKVVAKDDEHGHKPGQFGGLIVPIGRDNYHAEAVFQKDGVLRLYTLGQDEARVLEVEAQTLAAFVKPEGGTEAAEFTLKPDPQDGDASGKTSRFTGTLPKELWGKRLEVTIPTLRVGGERFRVGFKSAGEAHAAMPPPVVGEKEKQLFLTAGGKYTDADIKSNKGLVPSQKFKDFVAEHDDPKPGDAVCPVTATKANPECSWVVDGQTYQFCCPPCVTDFVKTAKSRPEKLKKASDYRKPEDMP